MPAELGGTFELALTHRSFAFEQPEAAAHNERLEFLGDAILGAIVTDLIFRAHPDLSEGEMARLRSAVVNTQALADLAARYGVGDHIRLGKGEESSGGRTKSSLLADTFEAIIGAVYLERGLDQLRDYVDPILRGEIEAALATEHRYDSKTALQEIVVRETSELPVYRLASSGPDHDRRYSAHVYVNGELYGSGIGRSKKEAEQLAAREALARFSEREQGDARAS
ncbi:MAG: ribonuclease III [Actinomycetota bacterium]